MGLPTNGFQALSRGRFRENIPSGKIVWTKGQGDFSVPCPTLGFVAQGATGTTAVVALKFRHDESADIYNVNLNQEYSGCVASVVDADTTATKIVFLV